MNAPVKHLTATIQSHAKEQGLNADALDEMVSHNLAGFFGALFEIERRIKSENKASQGKINENN